MLILLALLLLSPMTYADEFDLIQPPSFLMHGNRNDDMRPVLRRLLAEHRNRNREPEPMLYRDDSKPHPCALLALFPICFTVGGCIGHFFAPSDNFFEKDVMTGAKIGMIGGAVALTCLFEIPIFRQNVNTLTEYLLKEKAE